jgi:hypothetical protein
MTHRADNMNDIFENNVLVRGTLTADNLAGNGSGITNTLPIGSGLLWYTAAAPANYLLCKGQELSRTTYASLFAVIGTIYGSTSGTVFNLPNFTNKYPKGENGNIGNPSGDTYTASAYSNVSDTGHSHSLPSISNADVLYTGSYNIVYDSGGTGTGYADISDTGHQHNFEPPNLEISYIIKYQ